jgi:hypothetical protein
VGTTVRHVAFLAVVGLFLLREPLHWAWKAEVSCRHGVALIAQCQSRFESERLTSATERGRLRTAVHEGLSELYEGITLYEALRDEYGWPCNPVRFQVAKARGHQMADELSEPWRPRF